MKVDFYHYNVHQTINWEYIWKALRELGIDAQFIVEPPDTNISKTISWDGYKRIINYLRQRDYPYLSHPRYEDADAAVTTQKPDWLQRYKGLKINTLYGSTLTKDAPGYRKAKLTGFDGILAHGWYSKQRIITNGIPAEKVAIMGFPKYVDYFHGNVSRQKWQKIFNLNPERKTIVYLPSWHKNSSIDVFLDTIGNFSEEFNILIKPHHNNIEMEGDRILKMRHLKNVFIQDAPCSSVPFYVVGDIVIADTRSGAFAEGILTNSRLIGLHVRNNPQADFVEPVVYEMAHICETPEQLLEAVDEFTNSGIDKYHQVKEFIKPYLFTDFQGRDDFEAARAIREFIEQNTRTIVGINAVSAGAVTKKTVATPADEQVSLSTSELNNIIPPEIKDGKFYFLIRKLTQQENIKTILEIGSSSGTGSTEAFVTGLSQNPNKPTLFCMEISKPRFAELQKRYAGNPNVKCYNISSISVDKFPTEQQVSAFYSNTRTALNNYPIERILGWLRQDIEYLKGSGVCNNGIDKIKQENKIKDFDMVLIDGSEFAGAAEFEAVYGARFILLDDINSFKNYDNYKRLLKDPNYSIVEENWQLRNGYAVFARNNNDDLPIHFFTIVLNGQPFISQHIQVFKELPFQWHWHIIEGVAELKHDTAWSVQFGGRITSELHRNGLSNDGTTEYIDELVKQFPENVTVYRKAGGAFWDGKLEMVNAPLANISEQCLLWQIDADELWTKEQICTARQMFIDNSERTAAYYFCWFFVGANLVITTRDTYGNNTNYEWLRTWRFKPGCRWRSHEPPQLCRQNEDGRWVDLAKISPLRHSETEAKGLVFRHYAYVSEKQMRFKELYYGYEGAVEKWNSLQKQAKFPVLLREYFPWVKDQAQVDRIQTQGLCPIIPKNTFNQRLFNEDRELSSERQISCDKDLPIGNVLTVSDLSKIRTQPPITNRNRKNILVVSHERAGTHFLINTIAFNFPYYLNDEISVLGSPEDLSKIFTEFCSREERRIFKSHHQFGFFEPFFDEIIRHFQVFYVVRDGRDVLTSCFHYFNKAPADKFPHTDSISKFLATNPSDFAFDKAYSLRQACNMIERWCMHIESWLAVKDKITIVRYEDLKYDFENTVGGIANILGLSVSEKLTMPTVRDRSISARKGVAGDWKNHFTDRELATFNDIASGCMSKLGYYDKDFSDGRIERKSDIEQSRHQPIELPDKVKNIVWVRPDSIGDSVLAASMLQYIQQKYGDAKINVVCQEHVAEFYQACPYVNEVITFNRNRIRADESYRQEIINRLRMLKPELSLNSVYSRELLTDVLAIECGAKQRIAMEGDLSNISVELRDRHNQLYTKLITSDGEHKPELERHRDFLCGLGIDVSSLGPVVWTSDEDERFAEKFFRENELRDKQTIALFAGAQHAVRLYDKYGQSLSEFCKKNQLKVIGLGTSEEWEINQRNLDAIGVEAMNLSGKVTLRQSAAILRRCRMAVGAETGLAHISCAVNTPNVILLGGGHFGRFMPYSPLTSVVCLPLDCYGCGWKCRYEKVHCVRDIRPEVISEAVRQTLERTSQRPRVFVQNDSLWESKPNQPRWKSFDGFLDIGNVEIIPIGQMRIETDEESQGQRLLREHYGEESLETLIKAVEENPDSTAAHNNIGRFYLQKGQTDKTLKHFTKALKIDPYDHTTVLNCGQMLTNHGRIEDAEKLYWSYLQVNPNDDEITQAFEKLRSSKAAETVNEASSGYKSSSITAGEDVCLQQNQTQMQGYKYLASAIVSTYNAERFIRSCLADLVNQTLFEKENMEIVVVNSGSEQNEEAIIREYQQRYNNIRYIKTEERETVYQAWNRAIKAASGKYITTANTDDRRRKDCIEVLARALEENPDMVLAYGDSIITNIENETFDRCTVAGHLRWPDFDREKLLRRCCIGPHPVWKRAIHDEMGYFDESYKCSGDYEFWLRIAQKYDFIHIPELLGLYWLNENTISRKGQLPLTEAAEIKRKYQEKYRDLLKNKIVNSAPQQKDNRRGKILYVVHEFPPRPHGGTGAYVYSLSKEMQKKGYQVCVAYPVISSTNDYACYEGSHDGIGVVEIHIPKNRSGLLTVKDSGLGACFEQYLKNKKFDLVHFQHLINLSGSLIDVTKNLNIPCIVTLHDFWFMCHTNHLFRNRQELCSGPESVDKCINCFLKCDSNWPLSKDSFQKSSDISDFAAYRISYLKDILKLPDRILAPSKYVKGIFDKYGMGDGKIEVHPLGIQPFQFRPKTTRRQGVVRFAFLGNVGRIKGLGYLLEAFSKVKGNAELAIYGGRYDSKSIEIMHRIPNVSYEGAYTKTDLPRIFSDTDIVVVPSLNESYSLVTREALHGRVPVLASRIGSISEAVRDGENGILFEPGNIRELTEKIEYLIANPERIERLRENIKQVKTIVNEANELEAIYQQTMAKKIHHIEPTDKLKFAIKMCTHTREHLGWGDTNFANSLTRALTKSGHNCEIHFHNEWDQADRNIDIVIHLKGLFRYVPKPYNFNILWIISHPELHTIEEINQFDVVFCASKLYFENIKEAVRIPCFYLPQATDSDVFKPFERDLIKDIDILFVGNNNYHNDKNIKCRQIIQDLLDTGKQYKLYVVGKGWDGYLDERYIKADFIDWEKLPQLYTRAKIILNDHRKAMKQFGFINNRTFDLAALKAFQISDYVKGMEELGIVTYKSPEDLREKLDYFLQNEEQRQRIANINHELCKDFSFTGAVRKILDVVEKLLNEKSSGKIKAEGVLPAEGKSADIVPVVSVSHPHPKVSIIISCYNCEKFLPECLDSIRNQTMCEWELLLLDDASTDGTKSVIEKYSQMDERIKPYYFETNDGPYIRRNFGIERAGSDFIVIHDADDIMCPNKLEVLYNEITKDPQLVIVGSFYRKFLNEFKGLEYTEVQDFPTEHSEIVNGFLSGKEPICHASAIIRKDLFEAIGLYDENRCGCDSFWLTKVAIYAHCDNNIKLKNIPEFLMLRRMHSGSQTGALPTFDPRSRRFTYVEYYGKKLNEITRKIGSLPYADIKAELKSCECSDFIEKYSHIIEQAEHKPLETNALVSLANSAAHLFNTRRYVTCISGLGSLEKMGRDIVKRFKNYDLLRAMAYFALDMKEQCLEHLNREIQNHNNPVARQFIFDYFENRSKDDVKSWCLQNDKIYDLRIIYLDNETSTSQISNVVTNRHIPAEQKKQNQSFQNHSYEQPTPSVSVVMPAYNAQDYIKDAIDSVLSQSYEDFELIIVDDGSTDNTKDIIAGYKNDKIKYFCKENAGVASARNMGIKNSKGTFIINLDSDDMITPDFIAKHMQEFQKNPEADLLYCDDRLIDSEGKLIRVIERPEYTNQKFLIRDLFRCGYSMVPFRSCTRRSVYDKIGFYDENLLVAEDYDMMRRFVKSGMKMHHLKEALYLRRVTSENLSTDYSVQKAECHFDVVKQFTETFSYDELFPDVDWDKIAPVTRQLHAKCLAAMTYLAIGQSYVKSNASIYAQTAFEQACSQLHECLEIDPNNQQVRKLYQKCEFARDKCSQTTVNVNF